MQPTYPPYVALAALALGLSACGSSDKPAEPAASEDAASVAAPAPSATPADAGSPAVVPEAEKGETGARNLLLDFARAIEFGDFDQAYDLLGDTARANIGRDAFVALFDGFGKITVSVPSGSMEGAAGSLYYEVPTTITGSTGKTLTGTTVLRRVNDVPGATAEQLRWHIESFTVEPG